MGAPKGLYELEQLIFKTTNLSAWLGPEPNFDDVPYYDYFPLNRRLKFRALLQNYGTGDRPNDVAGYKLTFINNSMDFDVEAPRDIDLSRLDGYIVDATGFIKRKTKAEYVFVATQIHSVRRYPKFKRQG